MFALYNSLFAYGICSILGRLRLAARQKLKDSGAMPTAASAMQPNLNLNQRPPRALFCLKLDNSCCYARYRCGNCNVVVKLVQEYHYFYTFYFSSAETVRRVFLMEANSYKRELALRNSRLVLN